MLKNRITGFVIMDAPAESHRTMDSWIAMFTLCVNISRTRISNLAMHLLSEQEESAPAHVQLNQEPYGLHTSFQRTGWSAAFPVQRENHPRPAPHDQTQL